MIETSTMLTIARPYARAAFAFAVEHQAVEKWQQMLAFATSVMEQAQMYKLLHNSWSYRLGASILCQICEKEFNEYANNLLRLIAYNHRLIVLPEILRQFIQLHNILLSHSEVKVISAHPLSTVEQKNISIALSKRLTHTITLHCHVDKSILAGLIIQIGDNIIDGSVRGKLSRLANQLHTLKEKEKCL